MAAAELRAEPRAVVGKRVRYLRRDGLVPANLYGPGRESRALQVPARELRTLLRHTTATTLLPLVVAGEPAVQVLVRDVQRHPVTEQPLHVDLYAMAMNVAMRAAVPLHFVGDAPAVTQLNGTIVHNVESVEVEALPSQLPGQFEVDLSVLVDLHALLRVSDLAVPTGVTILTPPETTLVTVVPPRIQEEEVPSAEPTAAAEAAGAEETAAEAETTDADTEATSA